jgi:hypothetical protein
MSDSELKNGAGLGATDLFGPAGAAIQGMRLRVENQIVVSVDGLLAPLQEARRLFEDRKFRQASARADQVHRDLEMKIEQWERAAEARLQALRQSRNLAKVQQLKIQMADVKRQSRGAHRLLSTLRSALEVVRAKNSAE